MEIPETREDKYELYKTASKPNTVHHAAEVGDLKELENYVSQGIHQGNPESVTLQARENVLGMMPLHLACEHGQLEAVEFLIKKRVDLDAGDYFRVTAMHLAGIENHYEIVRIMLKARATVDPVDSEGDMPIHWAATKGHADVIELLVSHKSPVDPVNKSLWTPLHRAAYNARREAASTLVKLGASLHAKNKDGNTPLHLAAYMNHLSLMELLLTLGAKMNIRNNRGQTPYDFCISDGARELLDNYGYQYAIQEQANVVIPPEAAAARAVAAAAELSSELGKLSAGIPPRRRLALKDEFPDVPSPSSGSFSAPTPSINPKAPSIFLDEALDARNAGAASPYVAAQHKAQA